MINLTHSQDTVRYAQKQDMGEWKSWRVEALQYIKLLSTDLKGNQSEQDSNRNKTVHQ